MCARTMYYYENTCTRPFHTKRYCTRTMPYYIATVSVVSPIRGHNNTVLTISV